MSSFLVLSEGDTRNRWRDGSVSRELWRGSCVLALFCARTVGPEGSSVFWRVISQIGRGRREKEDGRERGERGERERESRRWKKRRKRVGRRLAWKKIGVKKDGGERGERGDGK
ncbi:hypothetical protein TNCV_399521 [Trichonephila clavipes]|nr:hypothetical protein TNCV_399521 [Trichonephila clavipes]